ncbi:hypothetical protein BMR10_08215 [Methylococcaceae bacterium CS4]|nr:hypothetical protein BMR10_08215 [Methylococcaceae bacterium CS4]
MILLNVRWYLAYPLSYRNLEEIAEERGYHVDHSTLNRWVINYAPELEKEFHKKKRPVNGRWRMDETYIKVKGEWKYFYRAVDKEGNTIDFLLTAKRDMKAAKRFFKKAIKRNGRPELVNIDKSGSNKAALNSINKEDSDAPKVEPIVIRQCKYLNNIIEPLSSSSFIKSIFSQFWIDIMRLLLIVMQTFNNKSYLKTSVIR